MMDGPEPGKTPVSADGKRVAKPCILVIFGGAGDLTKRLLMPALHNLAAAGLLPDEFAILGVSRTELSEEQFRKELGDGLAEFATRDLSADMRDWLTRRLFYHHGDFENPATYAGLGERLNALGEEWHTGGSVLFYLATPPAAFETVVKGLGEAGLTREEGGAWRRVIVEKPFGTDLASARALNASLLGILGEHQIFRIDHYLGKETVQNIMVLRFANGLFEPLWSREHVDHVQITVAEAVAVGTRGRFYEATGALRDMVPNHLFQLLTLIAMEPPARFDADAVRSEKQKVLESIHPFGEDVRAHAARGQYAGGVVDGKAMPAYRATANVAPDSRTETFAALRIMIDNWRWAGVPFYLRTGKALAARRTEIAIRFKQAPFAMFRDTPVDRLGQNVLVMRIQPNEGIALHFNAKVPGQRLRIEGVRMDMKYAEEFQEARSTGYETLIYDCMMGDATLFQRADNVEAGWTVVQPVIDAWAADTDPPAPYFAGGQGPDTAKALLAADGRAWRPIA